ncbi:hypothetical protein TRIP_E50127 [uncultured Spirochaetota bacterium]|jgi:hypothetical protein|uniref:Glycosyl hydrolase family 31 C-terminal domain-containing protein n=1 Tax=uncultured Spirochaetota bacterium TaxID=460511 RepID=A0A652ZZ72_9SPIR|nr:hypothetical protein TRIP_E50127 [uncultured Spirochaetota bacterium]
MISCSPWKDGFELRFGDTCLMRHSAKTPGLFISRKSVSISELKNNFPLLWKGLGPCSLSLNEAERELSFPGAFTAKLKLSDRSVEMSFSGLADEGRALALRFPAAPDERFFGLGNSSELRLRRGKTYPILPDMVKRTKRFPTVFSSRNWWMRCEDIAAAAAWSFKRDHIDLCFAGIPKKVILGGGGDTLEAMESLASFARPEARRPPGPSPDIAAPAIGAPVLHLSDSGPRYEELRPLLEKAGIKIGLLVDDRANGIPEIEALRIGQGSWESFLRDSGYRPIEETDGAGWDPKTITAQVLSLSLSGGFNPFIPVSRDNGTSGAKGYCLRWLDLAPFGPLFELSPPGTREAGRSVWERLAVATTLFAMLRPYREQCAAEWEGKAIPGLRHPAFLGRGGDGGDHGLWGIADEYLFGQDVLVAPSDNDKGAHGKWGRALVLPPGEWVHLWTSRRYPSGKITVEDPPGRPAVFYRKESEFASLFDEIRKKAARLG